MIKLANPGISSINRNWVVETITDPIITTAGELAHTASLLSVVEDAYVLEVKGSTSATLQVSAYVSQSHGYPGGSSTLSSTLEPGVIVLSVNQNEAGSLVPAATGTLTGVVISVMTHGT